MHEKLHNPSFQLWASGTSAHKSFLYPGTAGLEVRLRNAAFALPALYLDAKTVSLPRHFLPFSTGVFFAKSFQKKEIILSKKSF